MFGERLCSFRIGCQAEDETFGCIVGDGVSYELFFLYPLMLKLAALMNACVTYALQSYTRRSAFNVTARRGMASCFFYAFETSGWARLLGRFRALEGIEYCF